MLSRTRKINTKLQLNKNIIRFYRSATDDLPATKEIITSNNICNDCYKKELNTLLSYQMETNKYLKCISQDINDNTYKINKNLNSTNEQLNKTYKLLDEISLVQILLGMLILIKI